MKIQNLDAAQFRKELEQSDKPLVVDFWAEWCHPCRLLGQTLEELADLFEERARIFKLNIDRAIDLCREYQVVSIPAVLIFKDGKEVDRVVGAVPRDVLLEKLKRHCP